MFKTSNSCLLILLLLLLSGCKLSQTDKVTMQPDVSDTTPKISFKNERIVNSSLSDNCKFQLANRGWYEKGGLLSSLVPEQTLTPFSVSPKLNFLELDSSEVINNVLAESGLVSFDPNNYSLSMPNMHTKLLTLKPEVQSTDIPLLTHLLLINQDQETQVLLYEGVPFATGLKNSDVYLADLSIGLLNCD